MNISLCWVNALDDVLACVPFPFRHSTLQLYKCYQFNPSSNTYLTPCFLLLVS